MKLSTKNIISVAIALATTLNVHARPTVGLKGVDKLIHSEQEKVNHKVREEFIGLEEQEKVIDFTPYAPLFDLVCQSDLTDWCNLYPEQCSYVKTLCVKNENDGYCAFDVYQNYIKHSNSIVNNIYGYIDLCDDCLIEMANEFQKVSQDEEIKNEMKTFSEMCRVKLFMDSYLKENQHNEEAIISSIASFVPLDRAKLKRNVGKIHSFKNPDAGGFLKSNGKIKYGHVGINEKINTFINYNKERSTQAHKRQENEAEGGVVNDDFTLFNAFATKISTALTDIKELALQKVSTIFDNLEFSINSVFEEKEERVIYVYNPEMIKEEEEDDNVITSEFLSDIKNILNSHVASDDDKEEEETTLAMTAATTTQEPTMIVEDNNTFDDNDDNNDEIPTEPIDDIFQINENPSTEKKSKFIEIFHIPPEVKEENVMGIAALPNPTETESIAEPTEIPSSTVEQEIPTEESGTEGDDELDEDKEDETAPHQHGHVFVAGPPNGKKPINKPEFPIFNPGKFNRPNKGWKVKGIQQQNKHQFFGGNSEKPTILQTINKIFEENKFSKPSTPNDPSDLYMPFKKWVKKNEYVVSKKEEEVEIVEEVNIHDNTSMEEKNTFSDIDLEEGKSIKLNKPDHRNNDDDDEEAIQIGTKKISFINSVHPTKPSLNFRNHKGKDTH
ncbi:hypothetical protein BCR36DRAFT_330855 [Piromyces finnis]|uniref:Uncharacterized protein n=1 Tax=Piromyces finnis TaxID=1754191 RepID=A0A1Y1V4D9_9FUNG|nr:hypothetical protein BCR36DRAFT_330855 [Piromyces finnis]|eukprot:ORX47090.1 hypothetical protein BCR36DRAFT_330855 [Piromyces finnis]